MMILFSIKQNWCTFKKPSISLVRSLVYIFILSSTFTVWFALTPQIRLPVAVLLMLLGISLPFLMVNLQKHPLDVIRDKEDIFFLVFLYLVWLSYCFGFGGQRSFNHAVAYSFTLFGYYLLVKIILRRKKIKLALVEKLLAYSFTTCLFIIILEFICVNLFDFKLRPFFVSSSIQDKVVMSYFQMNPIIKSVPGVAEEPGSMAVLLNIVAPIALHHYLITKKRFTYYVILILYIVSLFMTISTAGLLIALTSAGIVWILTVRRVTSELLLLGGILSAIAVALITWFSDTLKIMSSLLITIIDKVSLSGNTESDAIRTSTWGAAIDDWLQHPILGNGPGYGVEQYTTGYHSIFLTILADVGMPALLLFVTPLIMICGKIFYIDASSRPYYLFSFIAAIIHFNVVGDFYHAPFWITLILIQLTYSRLKTENRPVSA